MNQFILSAVILAVLIGLSASFDLSTPMGQIKDFIQAAKDKCSSCQDPAYKVLARTSLDDICNAVDVYAVCSIACISNPVTDKVQSAQQICDAGAGAIQVSIILLLLTAIARILF